MALFQRVKDLVMYTAPIGKGHALPLTERGVAVTSVGSIWDCITSPSEET